MTQKKKNQKREPHQRKVSCKGRKSMRGQADNPYGERKKQVNFSLTPTAHANLTTFAQKAGLSATEVLERLLRMEDALQAVLTMHSSSQEQDSSSC